MSSAPSSSSLINTAQILDVVSALSRHLTCLPKLENFLEETVLLVKAVLQVDRVIVCPLSFSTDSSRSKTNIVETVGSDWSPLKERLSSNPELATLHLSNGQPTTIQAIDDLAIDSLNSPQRAVLEELQVRASLTVPIFYQHNLWGLLMVHQCSSPSPWHDLEIKLLQQVALQIEVSLGQINLQNQLSALTAQKPGLASGSTLVSSNSQGVSPTLGATQERLLRLITDNIRCSLDLTTILATTVTEVQHILQADRVLVFQLYPNRSGRVIQEAVLPEYPSVNQMQWLDICFLGNSYDHYLRGNYRIVANVESDLWAPCLIEFMRSIGVKSKLVVPILQGDSPATHRVWGLLIVHSCTQWRQWQNHEAELLQQIASQLAIAIHQSELYQQLKQLNSNLEKQVQERTSQLQLNLNFKSILHQIIERVRSSLDQDQILQTAVNALGEGLGVISCNAALYKVEQGLSTVCYEYNPPLLPLKGKVFHLANHPEIYQPLLRGECFQFCNLALNPIRGHKAILVCAIADQQQVWGDLWLINDRDYAFRDWETQLVQQVANQCAIALRQSLLYQTAQAQVQELERLNQLKDNFLSTVSHELRTPMSNIKMATQMLEIGLQPLGILSERPTNLHRYFGILKEECQREIGLINDLLDLARLDAGVEALSFNQVLLQIEIPQIVEPFLERTQSQQQYLLMTISDSLPVFITDLSYLQRILAELLHNACKYTPRGGTITVSARLYFRENQVEEEVLQISITNTGVEIPAKEWERIFDRFYRIPNSDPWKHGGTGLGLALVRKLVEQLRGEIKVSSNQQTTTFTVEIPSLRLEGSKTPLTEQISCQ